MATFFENFRKSGYLPTRGDLQKIRRTRRVEYGSEDTSNTRNPAIENPSTTPKAPNFSYKNPATSDKIAYWRKFADEGTMRHYDDLMHILDKTTEMKSVEEIRDYLKQLKNTTAYKIIPGIQFWVNDFESLYSPLDERYDISYPIDVMMYQTTKALEAYENGYNEPLNINKKKVPSPSELLNEVKSSYK